MKGFLFDENLPRAPSLQTSRPVCVELARSGQIRAVTCPEVLRERAEKLSAKLSFSDRQVDETLADYLSFHTLVEIPVSLKLSHGIRRTTQYWNVRRPVRRGSSAPATMTCSACAISKGLKSFRRRNTSGVGRPERSLNEPAFPAVCHNRSTSAGSRP